MSLAYVSVAPALPTLLPDLDPTHSRVVARSWHDRACDTEVLLTRLDRLADDLVAVADTQGLLAITRLIHAFGSLETVFSDIARHHAPYGAGRPTALMTAGNPHPNASDGERALQGLVDVACLAAGLQLHLLHQDLEVLHPTLHARLHPLVRDAQAHQEAVWKILLQRQEAAAEHERAAVASSLLNTFHQLHTAIDSHTSAWVGLSTDLCLHGVREGDVTRTESRQWVTAACVPRLEHVGFAAWWAWRRSTRTR
jgi:hypothetical protein